MAILDPMIPMALTLTQLVELYPAFSDATSLFDLQSEGEDKLNITVVTFGNETHGMLCWDPVLEQNIPVNV